jgi:hypothetical protein
MSVLPPKLRIYNWRAKMNSVVLMISVVIVCMFGTLCLPAEAKTIGILAYGSVISDPGTEIAAVRVNSISVETPFKIEFGRSSRMRDGAPTLVPVQEGGAKVKAVVIILAPSVLEREAADLLWRRETRKVGSGRRYDPPAHLSANNVLVKKLTDFAGLDVVLYTDFPPAGKLRNPTPGQLAGLAIESAQAPAGAKGMDGISYLIAVRDSGIRTPLMPQYEKEILARTKSTDLKQALDKIKSRGGQKPGP